MCLLCFVTCVVCGLVCVCARARACARVCVFANSYTCVYVYDMCSATNSTTHTHTHTRTRQVHTNKHPPTQTHMNRIFCLFSQQATQVENTSHLLGLPPQKTSSLLVLRVLRILHGQRYVVGLSAVLVWMAIRCVLCVFCVCVCFVCVCVCVGLCVCVCVCVCWAECCSGLDGYQVCFVCVLCARVCGVVCFVFVELNVVLVWMAIRCVLCVCVCLCVCACTVCVLCLLG